MNGGGQINFPSVTQALKTVLILVVLLWEHSFWHIVSAQIVAVVIFINNTVSF